MEQTTVHKFQEAGLGTAPFTFEYAVHGDWDSCQFCGHDIKERCYIKDSTGKLFYVGNECVNQTGDEGLITTAKEKIKELRKKLRHEREAKQILIARMFLYDSQQLRESYLKADKSLIKREESLTQFIRNRMKWGSVSYRLQISKSVMNLTQEIFTEKQFSYYLQDHVIENLEWKLNEEIRLEQEKAQLDFECRQAECLANQKEIQKSNQYLIDVLQPMSVNSGFARDMAARLRYSELHEFSPRQIEVIADIYGKTFGQRNTEAYKTAYAEVYWKGCKAKEKS